MNFIRTQNGTWLNLDRVKYLGVDDDGHVRAILGNIVDSNGRVVAYDEVIIRKCETRELAQVWLNVTVRKLLN